RESMALSHGGGEMKRFFLGALIALSFATATSAQTYVRGYLAALADQVLAFAAMTVVPQDRLFRTINPQVNLVKVGRSQPLTIEARLVAQTRQLITVRAEFRRGD